MEAKNRSEILKFNPVFTQFLVNIQDIKYREYFDNFDSIKDVNPFPKINKFNWIGNNRFHSSKNTTNDFLTDTANTILELMKLLNSDFTFLMGDWSLAWLELDVDYKPVNEAKKFLRKTINESFDGGFLFRGESFLEFFPHLFWLKRCNFHAQEIFISFNNSSTIISICKYGVLHFEYYKLDEKNRIEDFLKNKLFVEITSCSDPVLFDNFEGRVLKI